MPVTKSLYNTVFRRTSTFAVVVIAGAFVFERSIDMFTDFMWRKVNKGKLFEDVELKYQQIKANSDEEEEEED